MLDKKNLDEAVGRIAPYAKLGNDPRFCGAPLPKDLDTILAALSAYQRVADAAHVVCPKFKNIGKMSNAQVHLAEALRDAGYEV